MSATKPLDPPPATAPDVRPDHAVVGVSDPAASTALLVGLGFVVLDERRLAREAAEALYGLGHLPAVREVALAVPGSATGGVRLVGPLPVRPGRDDDPYRRGGHALDLYSTDLDASLTTSGALGAATGPLADYDFGPVHLRQGMATGPDDLPLVFVEIAHRLPSVLDRRPDRLHSELHSVVWAVDDIDAATTVWTDVVGLELRSRFPITEPAVSAFMGLPRPTALTMSVLTGPGAAAPRVELLAYDGEPGEHLPARPLQAGGTAPVLRAEGQALVGLLARLAAAGAEVGPAVDVPALDGAPETARAVLLRSGSDTMALEIRTGGPGSVEAP